MTSIFLLLSFLLLWIPSLSPANIPYPAQPLRTGIGMVSQNRIDRVQNMPQVLDVADFQFCSISAAYYVLQHYYCEVKNLNCSNLARENQLQYLDLASRNRLVVPGDQPEDIQKQKLNRSKRIELFNGGNALRILESVVNVSTFVKPESCMPLDQFISKVGGRESEAKKVEAKYYESLPAFSATEGSAICVDCLLQELNFGSRSMSNPDLKQKQLELIQLGSKFESYLYQNVVASCSLPNLAINPKPAYKFFPNRGTIATIQEISAKIQEVLRKGRPITLNNFCIESKKTTKVECVTAHATTIVDYDEGCSVRGCYPRIKILESKGQSFQKSIDDGWVGLDNLLNHLEQPVNYSVLAWLELPEGFQKK